MIILSFLRTKTTKIYIIIITLMFLVINMLNISINYLSNLNNYEYQKKSLMYYESNYDRSSYLYGNDNLVDVKETLKFKWKSDKARDFELTEFELKEMILVYADTDNKYNLKKDEIIVLLNHNRFENDRNSFKDYINQKYEFLFNEKGIDLTIKDFEKTDRGHIIISKELYNDLRKQIQTYMYTAKFISEKKEKRFINDNQFNDDIRLHLDDDSNYEFFEKLENNLKIIQVIAFVCIISFILIIVVVNKNILSDLKLNVQLENTLGFNRWQIITNIFKRMLLLHFFSYLLSFVVSCIVVAFANLLLEIKIDIITVLYSFILILIIMICDLLLILIVDNKSNKTESR